MVVVFNGISTLQQTVAPGDGHYSRAQEFIDNGFHIMVTELDVGVSTDGGYPINPEDLQT